jgi:hypothetical protein
LSQDEAAVKGKGSQAFLTDNAGTADVITKPSIPFQNQNLVAKVA